MSLKVLLLVRWNFRWFFFDILSSRDYCGNLLDPSEYSFYDCVPKEFKLTCRNNNTEGNNIFGNLHWAITAKVAFLYASTLLWKIFSRAAFHCNFCPLVDPEWRSLQSWFYGSFCTHYIIGWRPSDSSKTYSPKATSIYRNILENSTESLSFLQMPNWHYLAVSRNYCPVYSVVVEVASEHLAKPIAVVGAHDAFSVCSLPPGCLESLRRSWGVQLDVIIEKRFQALWRLRQNCRRYCEPTLLWRNRPGESCRDLWATAIPKRKAEENLRVGVLRIENLRAGPRYSE